MPYSFRCAVCGGSACYGKGVSLAKGVMGTWYCYDHRPKDFLPKDRAKLKAEGRLPDRMPSKPIQEKLL